MYGVMGLVNAERHLEYLRSLTEFLSQEGIKEVVPVYVIPPFPRSSWPVTFSDTGFG